MEGSWTVLALSAISVGVLHTLVGPDHYLPFVAIGSAWGWSRRKLLAVTVGCGSLHVASSLIIALVIGGLMGLGAARVEEVFGWQGTAVAWMLVTFGLAYAAWGLWRPHRHRHLPDGSHLPEGMTAADSAGPGHSRRNVTIWALVLVFVFGPCEAMIPLVMLPSAQGSVAGIVLVLALFGVATVATMTAAVMLLHSGVRLLPTHKLTRLAHPMAGAVVALCGVAILFGL